MLLIFKFPIIGNISELGIVNDVVKTLMGFFFVRLERNSKREIRGIEKEREGNSKREIREIEREKERERKRERGVGGVIERQRERKTKDLRCADCSLTYNELVHGRILDGDQVLPSLSLTMLSRVLPAKLRVVQLDACSGGIAWYPSSGT